MGTLWTIIWIAVAVGVLATLTYWQLVIAEGTYLGQRAVTWLYDLTARRYDAIKGFDSDLEALFLGRPLAKALCGQPAPLVLDIGTGTGRLPLTLLQQRDFQGRIVGVDHSRKMLAIAAQKTRRDRERMWLIWQDATRLPFPDSTFDAVACLEMIEFTPHPGKLLAEAARVLKPGATFVTTRRRGFDAWLMPGKAHSRAAFERLLKRLGLVEIWFQPWQVDYDLVWASRPGVMPMGTRHPLEVLQCTHCGKIALSQQDYVLTCYHCGVSFRARDGVIEFQSVSPE